MAIDLGHVRTDSVGRCQIEAIDLSLPTIGRAGKDPLGSGALYIYPWKCGNARQ